MNIIAILPDPHDENPQRCMNDTGCGFTPCICNPRHHLFQSQMGTNVCRLCGAPEGFHDDEELRELIAEWLTKQ